MEKPDGVLTIERDKYGRPIKFSYKAALGTSPASVEERIKQERHYRSLAASIIGSACGGEGDGYISRYEGAWKTLTVLLGLKEKWTGKELFEALQAVELTHEIGIVAELLKPGNKISIQDIKAADERKMKLAQEFCDKIWPPKKRH